MGWWFWCGVGGGVVGVEFSVGWFGVGSTFEFGDVGFPGVGMACCEVSDGKWLGGVRLVVVFGGFGKGLEFGRVGDEPIDLGCDSGVPGQVVV